MLPEILSGCWLNGVQTGDRLDVHVPTVTPACVLTNPSAATVTYSIFDGGGTKVANGYLGRKSETGWFQRSVLLGTSGWTAGVCALVVGYAVSSVHRHLVYHFELCAGGDAEGGIHQLSEFRRPETVHIVHETEGGKILDGRSPSLAT